MKYNLTALILRHIPLCTTVFSSLVRSPHITHHLVFSSRTQEPYFSLLTFVDGAQVSAGNNPKFSVDRDRSAVDMSSSSGVKTRKLRTGGMYFLLNGFEIFDCI